MMEKIEGWLKKLFTSRDNETPCVARIMGFGSFIYANIMQGWSVVAQNVPFDLEKYGIGIGVLFAAVGALIGLKKGDEPDVKP